MSQLIPYFHITPVIRFLVTLFNAEQVDPTGARQSVFIKVIPTNFFALWSHNLHDSSFMNVTPFCSLSVHVSLGIPVLFYFFRGLHKYVYGGGNIDQCSGVKTTERIRCPSLSRGMTKPLSIHLLILSLIVLSDRLNHFFRSVIWWALLVWGILPLLERALLWRSRQPKPTKASKNSFASRVEARISQRRRARK